MSRDRLRTRQKILAIVVAVPMTITLYVGLRSYDLRHWIEFSILMSGVVAVFFLVRRSAD